ncbi:MAG: hypothetical protein JOZ10_03600 [Acidobacteria bacterium]|nr:hypothetical protein [Acidobacteriota bacterium]MBV9146605.1 hypothetical protein [Acidobacteriota bacterium]MBV9435315.1 hypothetical protein [Acidobacteriota bacterium]
MFELLTELLGYARKLLPLLEIYSARRGAQPMRDTATLEFQTYAAEALRAGRADAMELRASLEAVNQRLKVIDDQSLAVQRELSRLADQQRTAMIAVVIAAVASTGALILAIVAAARH